MYNNIKDYCNYMLGVEARRTIEQEQRLFDGFIQEQRCLRLQLALVRQIEDARFNKVMNRVSC